MGVVHQAVHGGAGQQGVAEHGVPLVRGSVAGDDHGSALVAVTDDLIEVVGFVVLQWSKAQVTYL